MDKKRVHAVLQYALLIAGQEDDFYDRELGPIHLIKYVYLADLAYARANNGETYTGVQWQFYNFGPWCVDVFKSIEPALEEIDAHKKTIESQYEGNDDFKRWSLGAHDLFENKKRSIPIEISGALQRYVHTYTQDTPRLLDFVYRTPPMLNAAPGEYLDFSSTVNEKPSVKSEEQSKLDSLSVKKQKKFKNAMKQLRDRKKNKKEKHGGRYIHSPVEPIYDDIYYNGVEWLDSLAGNPLPTGEFDAHFSEDVWKSEARKKEYPD